MYRGERDGEWRERLEGSGLFADKDDDDLWRDEDCFLCLFG
jgi:hypothetical protein